MNMQDKVQIRYRYSTQIRMKPDVGLMSTSSPSNLGFFHLQPTHQKPDIKDKSEIKHNGPICDKTSKDPLEPIWIRNKSLLRFLTQRWLEIPVRVRVRVRIRFRVRIRLGLGLGSRLG
jgi:hypothetical protein